MCDDWPPKSEPTHHTFYHVPMRNDGKLKKYCQGKLSSLQKNTKRRLKNSTCIYKFKLKSYGIGTLKPIIKKNYKQLYVTNLITYIKWAKSLKDTKPPKLTQGKIDHQNSPIPLNGIE